MIVTVRCGTSSKRWQSLPSCRMRYTYVTYALLPRWQSLVIDSRTMWCAFFSRQSRYSNAIHALTMLTHATQSFWIMRVHQSLAFSIFLNIFPCVTWSLTMVAKEWQALSVQNVKQYSSVLYCHYRDNQKAQRRLYRDTDLVKMFSPQVVPLDNRYRAQFVWYVRPLILNKFLIIVKVVQGTIITNLIL